MEIVLATIGGIVGGAGLLALLQSKSPLPSEADFKKAQDKLKDVPEDPDANTVAGKYMAFVLGDYDQGMVLLARGSDKTLKTLAEHERAPLYADTAVKKVGMADEWVAAAKTFPALFRIFYDRAGQWYAAAWPALEGPWKDKTRERGRKLAMSRPPGVGRTGLPTGWKAGADVPGARPPVLDGMVARTGSYSVKILPADEKFKDSFSQLRTDLLPVVGKNLDISAYILTDGTDNKNDEIRIYFFGQGKNLVHYVPIPVPADLPFWSRVYMKVGVPENAAWAVLAVELRSKKGNMWVDDISMKLDDKELIKNPSFEEK